MEQAGEHRQRGGLAGTVGTQQSVDLAALYLEVDPLDSVDVAEALGQLLDLDHGSLLGWVGLSRRARPPQPPPRRRPVRRHDRARVWPC